MNLATIISRIFDPIVVFSIAIIAVAVQSGMSGGSLFYFLTTFVLLVIVPPATLLFWAVKTKRVTDVDVSNRAQRVRVLLVFGLFLFIDYFVIKSFGNIALETLFVLFILWFLGFFIITLFWKISGHLAGLTFVLGLLIEWQGSMMLPLFFLIPLVAWARVVTKNHTIMQVIAGVLYSLFMLYLFKNFR
jgi:membrane-associated phospholipid phosphatase